MSIHFISGKPGAGKSFYGVKLAFEELRYGNRCIVTNLPLLVGELNAYYHAHYADDSGWKRYRVPRFVPFWLAPVLFWYLPEWVGLKLFPLSPEAADARLLQPHQDDITSRIHLISDDEMAVFFTKRPDATIEHIDREQWRSGKRPDYSVVKDSGVFFILDEVHIAFNSRAWAETGPEVLYYLSQHRKLGDDVICITQAVANVDKQFRSVAQDFTYIRNLAKETFGHFRLPQRFIRKTYSQPPSGDASEPMEMGSFTLDINGLAKCYDTAKGVGIHGRAGADKNQRKKGIHWLWFVIGLPVICYIAFHYLPRVIAHFIAPVPFKHSTKSPAAAEKQIPALPRTDEKQGFATAAEKQTGPDKSFDSHSGSSVSNSEAVTCVGWGPDGHGGWLVFTSDGETYSSFYKEVDFIHHREVSCLGKIYKVLLRSAFTEYQPPLQPLIGLPVASASPVNQADVTYIGRGRPVNRSPSGFRPPSASGQLGLPMQSGISAPVGQ